MQEPSKKKDRILGIGSILFAAFIMYTAAGLPKSGYAGDPGSAMMPFIGSGIMALFGILLVVKPTEDSKNELKGKQWIAGLKMFGLYILTAFLFWFLGFYVAVPVLIFFATFMMSKLSSKNQSLVHRLILALVFTAVASLVLYLAYVVGLKAALPRGVLWKWIG